MVTCTALSSLLSVYNSVDCIGIELAAASRFTQNLPQQGIHRFFSIPNAQFTIGGAKQNTGAKFTAAVIPSASADGYMGIDGESNILQIQRASLWIQRGSVTIETGLSDDLWSISHQYAWEWRSISQGAAETWGWIDRTDTGISARWHHRLVSVSFRLSSGEGMRKRERNNGQNASVLIEILPTKGNRFISASLFGQEGSLGFNQAQNHRLGGRLIGAYLGVHGGLEGLQAWGTNGDASATPFLLSTWIKYDGTLPYIGYIRHDRQQWGYALGQTTFIGAAYKTTDHAKIWIGAELRNRDPEITDYPGASGLESQQSIFIQFELNQKSTFQLGGK